jgi:hypothetical protein
VVAAEGTDATEEAGDDRESDLFRARLDQIINLKHELVQLVPRSTRTGAS